MLLRFGAIEFWDSLFLDLMGFWSVDARVFLDLTWFGFIGWWGFLYRVIEIF